MSGACGENVFPEAVWIFLDVVEVLALGFLGNNVLIMLLDYHYVKNDGGCLTKKTACLGQGLESIV
jgi:hypothetical protein